MMLIADTQAKTLVLRMEAGDRTVPLYSDESFELLSRLWLTVGWNQKYPYTFTWMGRPIIQLPEDMVRIQEVFYRVRPTVVVETGVAHGGSLVYYASLVRLLGGGRVIGVDIDIRPKNRAAIEAHELAGLITLIEGNSVAREVLQAVRAHVRPDDRVLVILDSNHSKQHVCRELEAYYELVSPGSYIVATDGIMADLGDAPRGDPSWVWDNPAAAAVEFAEQHPDFKIEEPGWPFNESGLRHSITHWPGAWLRRSSR